MFADLREAGEVCGKHRVARIMQEHRESPRCQHLAPACESWFICVSGYSSLAKTMCRPRSETLQALDFQDGIYIRTWQGWLYLAAVVDLYSRKVVGWSMKATQQHAKRLTERFGVGPQTAAVLVAVAGDNPERLKNESSLAALCGVTPLQASSGKTVRHRLNRGGDRCANNALWTIAMVRMRSDPRTRAYVERRTKEGLSSKEIHRCLKRYIVR